MVGIIALDLDGTLIHDMNKAPKEVEEYLTRLSQEGWSIIFITGRTFVFGHYAIEDFKFPYTFAVQNGALMLEMPSRKTIAKKYLSKSVIPTLDRICQDEAIDYIIYGGYETKDTSYYRSRNFSPELLDYFAARQKVYLENWEDVANFRDIKVDEFPSIKCFAYESEAQKVAKKIESELGLHMPVIRDPFGKFFVAQGTRKDINKGEALKEFKKIKGDDLVVIAAGDDNNDTSMLEIADVKIVMADAPEEVRKIADIIAPPASQKGIIKGLTEAIQRI